MFGFGLCLLWAWCCLPLGGFGVGNFAFVFLWGWCNIGIYVSLLAGEWVVYCLGGLQGFDMFD